MTPQDAGAAQTAPKSLMLGPSKGIPGRRRLAWLLFISISVAVAAWGILRSPWMSERRYSGMSLVDLERERAGRLTSPTLLYYVGRRMNEQGRFAAADPVLRNAVGLDPHSARLRDEWAKALLGSGLISAAFGELREFAGTHPALAESHLLLGKFYFTQRSMKHAVDELRKATEMDPRLGESWSLLAGALSDQRDAAGGLKAIQKAVELRPACATDHLLYGSLLTDAGQPEQARAEYKLAALNGPKQAAVRRGYAWWLLRTGREEDRKLAEAEASAAVQLEPGDGQAALALGTARASGPQPASALDPFKSAALLTPDDPAPALALSQLLLRLGNKKESDTWRRNYQERQAFAAEKHRLIDAISENPGDAEAQLKLARLLGLHGDVAGAVRHQSAARRVPPDSPTALAEAAADLLEGGHAQDSIPLARRAVEMASSSPRAHMVLGDAILALGDTENALKEYNAAIAWKPELKPKIKAKLQLYYAEKARLPNPAAQAFQQARKLESSQFGPKKISPEVMDLAKKAVELSPNNPVFLRYLLHLQVARKENSEAFGTGKRVLALLPNDSYGNVVLGAVQADQANTPEELADAEAHLRAGKPSDMIGTRHYGLGLVAIARKQGDLAVTELREALRLDPNSDVTYYKLALAEQMTGQSELAGRHMTEYRKRQETKAAEASALGDIAQQPDKRQLYARAAAFYDGQGRTREAAAIRAEAKRRFGPR